MPRNNAAAEAIIALAEANKIEPISLLDIAPAYRDVPLNDKQAIRINAITTRDLIAIITRFPSLQGLMAGRNLGPQDVASIAPDAITAIIAASVGHLGDPQYEKKAEQLAPDIQLDVLEAVFVTTFTRGFGPFVSKLTKAFEAVAGEVGRVPATASPRPPSPSVTPNIPKS